MVVLHHDARVTVGAHDALVVGPRDDLQRVRDVDVRVLAQHALRAVIGPAVYERAAHAAATGRLRFNDRLAAWE